MIDSAANAGRRLSIKVVHPPRFGFRSTPSARWSCSPAALVSRRFAACWRLAPDETATGGNWLFYSARTPRDLHYKADWEALCGAGKLHLHAAFSREGARVRFDGNALCFEAAPARRIDEEMLEPQTAEQLWALAEAGAYFYVCGRTGFARTVMQTMQTILARRDGAAVGASASTGWSAKIATFRRSSPPTRARSSSSAG